MNKYERPIIEINETLAEGVYAASGANNSDCMTVNASITQGYSVTKEGMYAVQVESNHDGSLYRGDGHAASGITVTLYFNQPVTCDGSYYQGESGTSYFVSGGNGTSTLTLTFSGATASAGTKYWGQIYIASEPGLALNSAAIACHSVY